MIGHCVTAPFTPGLTPQQPPAAQQHASAGTMPLQGLQGIGRTTGLEAAGVAQPGLEQQPVRTNHRHQRAAWQCHCRSQPWVLARALRRLSGHGQALLAAAGWQVPCALPRPGPVTALKETAGARKVLSAAPTTTPVAGSRCTPGIGGVSGASAGCVSWPAWRVAWVPRCPANGLWLMSHPQAGCNPVHRVWITRAQAHCPRPSCGSAEQAKSSPPAVQAGGAEQSGCFAVGRGLPACVRNQSSERYALASQRRSASPVTRRPLPPPTGCSSAANSGSDGQTLAALGTPRIDDGAATACLHAHQKTVGSGAADLRGLVGALHCNSWGNSRKSWVAGPWGRLRCDSLRNSEKRRESGQGAVQGDEASNGPIGPPVLPVLPCSALFRRGRRQERARPIARTGNPGNP